MKDGDRCALSHGAVHSCPAACLTFDTHLARGRVDVRTCRRLHALNFASRARSARRTVAVQIFWCLLQFRNCSYARVSHSYRALCLVHFVVCTFQFLCTSVMHVRLRRRLKQMSPM